MLARRALRTPMLSLLLATVVAAATQVSMRRVSDHAPALPNLHWEEGQPGCTFSRDDDGKYRYGFWTADYGIVLAVDSQELEKVRRRSQPVFALLLSVHYRGKESLSIEPGKIALEFVKHYRDVHRALDPDDLAARQQNNLDALAKETGREVREHPENEKEREAILSAREKDSADMIDFLKTRTLRAVKLDPGHPDTSGWLLFSTKSKWIDALQKQEEFVLRVPVGDRIVEFPFSLPASQGDLILRRRPEK